MTVSTGSRHAADAQPVDVVIGTSALITREFVQDLATMVNHSYGYSRVSEHEIAQRLAMGDSLEGANRVLHVATRGGQLVGCCSSTRHTPWTPSGCGHWGLLVVAVEAQGTGVATALVHAAEQRLIEAGLTRVQIEYEYTPVRIAFRGGLQSGKPSLRGGREIHLGTRRQRISLHVFGHHAAHTPKHDALASHDPTAAPRSYRRETLNRSAFSSGMKDGAASQAVGRPIARQAIRSFGTCTCPSRMNLATLVRCSVVLTGALRSLVIACRRCRKRLGPPVGSTSLVGPAKATAAACNQTGVAHVGDSSKVTVGCFHLLRRIFGAFGKRVMSLKES